MIVKIQTALRGRSWEFGVGNLLSCDSYVTGKVTISVADLSPDDHSFFLNEPLTHQKMTLIIDDEVFPDMFLNSCNVGWENGVATTTLTFLKIGAG